jgi:hypothetical protein
LNRPLLITDCDEVLLHMVVPFAEWLDEAHHIHFDLDKGEFVDALRCKNTGRIIPGLEVWPLLQGFFQTEMHRQQAIDGAVEAINTLGERADVVVLTNLTDEFNSARAEQLRAVGIDVPVFTNQGGKGEPLARIVDQYKPSVAVFVDDLAHQHASVEQHAPHVYRLHMVGEPRLQPNIKTPRAAQARIDRWRDATSWIIDRFEGVPL